jgi:hypothetical protein
VVVLSSEPAVIPVIAKVVEVAAPKSVVPVSVVDASDDDRRPLSAPVTVSAPFAFSAPPTLRTEAMVDEPTTANDPVVVALPLMVVEPTDTNPPLNVSVVEVAFERKGYAKFAHVCVEITPEEFVVRQFPAPPPRDETVRFVVEAVPKYPVPETVSAVDEAYGNTDAAPSPRIVVVAVRPIYIVS